MDAIRRVLAAEHSFLLNEVTALRGRRIVPSGWTVTSNRRPRVMRFEDQPAAERYFCDEVRRLRPSVVSKMSNEPADTESDRLSNS
jgi:hypothetical protein